MQADARGRPVRFLVAGATVVLMHEDRVTSFTATAEDLRGVESIFAYPMAMLTTQADGAAADNVTAASFRARWQVAVASEIAGLLGAAIASTVTYVSERKQFGRPLGSFRLCAIGWPRQACVQTAPAGWR